MRGWARWQRPAYPSELCLGQVFAQSGEVGPGAKWTSLFYSGLSEKEDGVMLISIA